MAVPEHTPPTATAAPAQSPGRRLLAAIPFALLLAGLWLVLSPQRDLFHLTLGGAISLVIAWATIGLVGQPPAIGGPELSLGLWLRFVTYLPWLGWQVVLSGLHVARIVLDPRLPVTPALTRIRVRYPSALAKLTLANSITLTPGTVTLDVDGDQFLVHALTEAGRRDLEAGEMGRRVSALFGFPDDGEGAA